MIVGGDLSPETARTVASALADLHQLNVPTLPRSFETVIEAKIARARKLIRWALPGLSEQVDAISENAARLIELPALGPTHRDMKPEHIVIDRSGNCVHLIDSSSLCIANPAIDLAALIVRIEHLARTHGLASQRVSAFCDDIIEDYFGRVPPTWRDSLAPGMSYATLLLAIHLIQGLKPNWRGIGERIVNDAFKALNPNAADTLSLPGGQTSKNTVSSVPWR
jgi:hypothetical protein